jgi:hypothetical protein
MQEIYVSTDVKADGPIPGPYSMLSFGSAAYLRDKTLIDTFSVNLEQLPNATTHPETMKWGVGQPEAWVACRKNLEHPEIAMTRYHDWLTSLPGEPVFVAYPATYDLMFIYWYLMRFVEDSPFKHHGLDIRTYAMAMMKTGYKASGKVNMPDDWFDDLPFTHKALDDSLPDTFKAAAV